MKKVSASWLVLFFGLIGIISALVFLNYDPRRPLGGYQQTVNQTITQPQIAEPQTLIIPKINVNASVEPVGQDSSGKMAVPQRVDDVGWYNLGSKPGEKGSAVIDGHLDTVTGAPAVFYYISQLSTGDQVIVTDKNGKNLTFEVTRVQNYPFDQVPLQEVFMGDGKPRLNLITCTGVWNQGTRNYSNRLVVYTELKS